MFTRLIATAAAVLFLATAAQAQNVKTFPQTKHTPPKQPYFPPIYKVPVYKVPVFYPPIIFPPVFRPPVHSPVFPIRPPYSPPYLPGYPWYGW